MKLTEVIRKLIPKRFKKKLKEKGWKYGLVGGILIVGLGWFGWIIITLPSPSELMTKRARYSTLIYDRNGVLLYKIYDKENRIPVKLSKLPKYVPEAFIAMEDANFYHHFGIDLKGISRALFRIVTRKKLEGGSTITQQLVKNTLLSPERTVKRKIKEAVLALAIEAMYSKDQILEMYLNTVSFGGTAYGIEAASLKYFGKHAKDLSLAEAALLAGLPAAPTKFSPFGANPKLAFYRQRLVLQRMVKEGYITQDQAQTALDHKLVFAPIKEDIKAPHFVMWVKDILVKKYGEEMVNKGGLKVITSLDYKLQQKAEKILKQEIDKVRKYHITNGALLVTQPKTGEVLAMVGSYDFFDTAHDGQVNVTLALRQPGSSIKPLTYALAVERGFKTTDIILDAPVSFPQPPPLPPYTPKNYDNKFHGPVTLRQALANSYNIPAVKLLNQLGPVNLAAFAAQMGITTWTNPRRWGLSLTLGSNEVKMVDLAVAYGVFANYGLKVPLKPILKIYNFNQQLIFNFHPQPIRVIKPGTAYIITHILSDNYARIPAFGWRSYLNLSPHQVAVKTGTSNGMRDNWTIGYTTSYLVAVWVGNNDYSPMSKVASGVTGASPIWNRTFRLLLPPVTKPHKFLPPNDVVFTKICLTKPPTPNHPQPQTFTYTEVFIKGTQPPHPCP